jgi:rSAM/selenodomain-associated transferase 2
VTRQLSLIVPVLNEAPTLPALLQTVQAQQGVACELIVCDGGSTDGTADLARQLSSTVSFPMTVLQTSAGRARQMNAGAAAARGEFFLFLHADSFFPDPLALRRGVDALQARVTERGDCRAAGRFALRFRRQTAAPSLAYYFYEQKARLNRPGCIHGDQGFLLPRDFFAQTGPFDEELPLLEDDRLAARIDRLGEWLLLPAELQTSARRFEVEGLAQRQCLNALLMNFAALGWSDFFRAAPGVYREQRHAGALQLLPFFRLIRALLSPLPARQRLRLWYGTGSYVLANAWQVAFLVDARRAFQHPSPPAVIDTPLLDQFDRRLRPLIDHPPGRLIAALLTWVWFRGYGSVLQWRQRRH